MTKTFDLQTGMRLNMQATKSNQIQITFTPQEAGWLRDAMAIASITYANIGQDVQSHWCDQFAKGLQTKINNANS
jgi:hypothetical protein